MDLPDDDNDHDYQNNHNHCHQLRCKLVTSRRWLKYDDQYCEVIMMVSIMGIIMVIMVTSWYCKLILIQATAAAQRIGRLFGLVRYNHNEHPDDDDDHHLHRPHICHFSSTNVLLGSIFLHMTIFSPLIILLTLVTNMSVAFAIIMNTLMMIMLIVTNTIREHYTLYFYWYPKQLLNVNIDCT